MLWTQTCGCAQSLASANGCTKEHSYLRAADVGAGNLFADLLPSSVYVLEDKMFSADDIPRCWPRTRKTRRVRVWRAPFFANWRLRDDA